MISKVLTSALAAIFLFAAGLEPAAAQPKVTFFQLEDADSLTVGDPLRLTIELEADAATDISLAPGTLPPELSLRSTPQITTTELDGNSVLVRIEIELAAFATGEIAIPPIRLLYVEESGIAGEIETAATTVNVTSVLPEGGGISPRDLKAQAKIGSPDVLGPVLLSVAAGVAGLIFVAAITRALRRRRRASKPIQKRGPIEEAVGLGLEDRTRMLLDQAANAFANDQDLVAYYSAIGSAVRAYLSERYGFSAFALTSGELEQEMLQLGIDRWQTRLVSGLLSQCDASVYARYAPAHERADADLTSAYEIVEMSRQETLADEVTAG